MPETGFTWPRSRRLTHRSQYSACYSRGQRHYTRYFVVFSLAGDNARQSDSTGFRLGLAVTRKCGNAVERNRIKRVLREFFRLHQQDMPAMDIVVTPKRHLRADRIHLSLVARDLSPLMAALRQKQAGGMPLEDAARPNPHEGL